MASKSKSKTLVANGEASGKKRQKAEPPSSSKGVTTPKKLKKEVVDDDDDDECDYSVSADRLGKAKGKAKGNASFYKFKQRGGPLALGSKEIPEGPEDCLAGLDFVVTGVMDSIQREDAEDLIKRHGGLVKSGVSKKTSYLVVGREPGESKTKKAKELKTKVIDEDGLFELIRNASRKSKPDANAIKIKASTVASNGPKSIPPAKHDVKSPKKVDDVIILDDSSDEDVQPVPKKLKIESTSATKPINPFFLPKKTSSSSLSSNKTAQIVVKNEEAKQPAKSATLPEASTSKSSFSISKTELATKSIKPTVSPLEVPSILWVDKYAPKLLKNVIGQHGPASPANKLLHWLTHWHKNRQVHGYKATSAGLFSKPGGDGHEFKAVLMSGAPGLGKTTTAILACKETGFTYVHLNASDSRSKRLLDEKMMSGVASHSLFEYFSPTGSTTSDKSIIIMDEVDGMAGNEDRGGVAEVIQLIKNAKVPVICICNDRSSPKMRSLSGYCYDLRFYRPRLEQIRGAMLSICAKEGLKIAPNAVDVIIEGSHQDIRQTIHNLYAWTVSKKTMSYDEAKANSTSAEKDSIKIGPFEACRAMFQATKGRLPGSCINEKMDLYFEDYSFVPLFIQENYLKVQSHVAKDVYHSLDLISKAADSFSLSDLIDRDIRSKQNWSLLPIHAVFSAVIPGNVMQGHLQGGIDFPKWLGKNSTITKNKRLVEDLRTHMHLRVSSNVTGLNLDYLPVMRRAVSLPLKNSEEGVDQVLNFINSYDLLKEDMDAIMEVTMWDGMKDPLKDIPASVKGNLTRQLNKGTHLNPYHTADVKKGRAKATDAETELLDEETQAALAVPDEDAGDDDDKVEKDTMIKAKKVRAPAKPRGGGAASTSKVGKVTKPTGRGKK